MNDIEKYTTPTGDVRKVPENSKLKGLLKRPDDKARTFAVHEILQTESQIIGRTREMGILEWIVINLPPDKKDGVYTLVSPSQPLLPNSLVLGAVLSGAIVNFLDGTITIEQKPNGRFKASKFNFIFKLGEQEGEFTDGEVDIPASE